MGSNLEKQADLLLIKNGFNTQGRKVYRSVKAKKVRKKQLDRNRKFATSVDIDSSLIKSDSKLFEERKSANISDGEYLVAEVLSELKIDFIRGKPMKGLVNPMTGFPLFFDFYLPRYRFVIEYDGPHHYRDEDKGKLAGQKIKDEAKNRFCRSNKIKMIRIPFWKKKRVRHILYDALGAKR